MSATNHLANTGAAAEPAAPPSAVSRQFLVFRLGPQECGIELKYVRKLLHYHSLTMVYDGARRVEGVAIADGVVTPLIDPRVPGQAAAPARQHLTAVIILDLSERAICMLVDDVLEMVALTDEEIGAVQTEAGLVNRYLIGMASIGRRDVILLDIDKLLSLPSADDEQDEMLAA